MGTQMTAAQRMARAAEWLVNTEAGGNGGWSIEKDDFSVGKNGLRVTVRKCQEANLEYISEIMAAVGSQNFDGVGAMVNGKNIASPITVGHTWWRAERSSSGETSIAIWQVLVSGGGLVTTPPIPTVTPGAVPPGPTLDVIYSAALNNAKGQYAAIYTEAYPSNGKIVVNTKYYGLDKASKDLLLSTITGTGGAGSGARNNSRPNLDDETNRWDGEIESVQDGSYSSGYVNSTGNTHMQVSEKVSRSGKVYKISVTATFDYQRDSILGGVSGGRQSYDRAPVPRDYVADGIEFRSWFHPQGDTGFEYLKYTGFAISVTDITAAYFASSNRSPY